MKADKLLTPEQMTDVMSQLPGDRIDPAYIASRVKSTTYHRFGETTTLCFLTLDNGFVLIGKSACVDPANYNQQIGEQLANKDATGQCFAFFGFLLAERNFRFPAMKGTKVTSHKLDEKPVNEG